MPADANAFERLIDRVLFSEDHTSGGGEEASRPWILLQALLVQNVQARSYAQRVVLRRAQERPQDLRRGGTGESRLRALVDLWPAGEREALAAAVLAGGARGEIWSPADQISRHASGYSTPPRRVSTPTWGPPFSDSPEPPRDRYSRDAFARKAGPSSSAISSSATTAATHRHSIQAQEVAYSARAVDSSAATVQLPRASGRLGREEVADSSSTVQMRSQVVASSLDAWQRASGIAQPPMAMTPPQRYARSRSLPAVQDGHLHRSPQLILDFGPSSSSGDDGRAAGTGEHVVVDVATNTMRPLGRRASGEDSRRRGGHRRMQDEVSSDDEIAYKRPSDEARHWSRSRRHNDELSEMEPSSGSRARKVDAERWQCWALHVQQVALKGVLVELRCVTEAAQLQARCSSWWRQCSTHLAHQHVQQLCNAIASSAAEAACARCSAAKLQVFATGLLRLHRCQAVCTLSKAGRSWQRVGRLAQLILRPRLRFGFQSWQRASHLDKLSESAAAASLRRFQSLCHHALMAHRAQQRRRCVSVLQQCALARSSRFTTATRQLAASMQRQVQKQLWSGFMALQATLRLSNASKFLGAVQLARHLEHIRHRHLTAFFSCFHSAALHSTGLVDAECTLQAMHSARERSLSRVVGAWQFICQRRRRLTSLLERAARGSYRWAWQQLWSHVIQRRCELHFGVLCAARLESAESDREQGWEAERANYEARLQEAWDREALSREREAMCQRGELQAHWQLLAQRQLRVVWIAWILRVEQLKAAQRLGSLFHRKQMQRSFAALQSRCRKDTMIYLQTQIDCFDAFVAKRNVICRRVMQRCTQKSSDDNEFRTILMAVSEWRRITCDSRRVESQRDLACAILDSFAKSALRRSAWTPWRTWHAKAQRVVCEARYEAEVLELHREKEDLRSALRATQLQAEAQLDRIGHEFRVQEQIRTDLARESSAARAIGCHRLWCVIAARKRSHVVRRLVLCMKRSSVPVALRRSAAGRWQQCATARMKDRFAQLRSAMYAAAIEQVRVRSRRAEGSARAYDTRKRMAIFAHMAYTVRVRRAAHELVSTFKGVADAKQRLHSMLRVCDVVRLRVGMRRLHEWEKLQVSRVVECDRQEVARAGEQAAGARLLFSLLAVLPRTHMRDIFAKLRQETVRTRLAKQRFFNCVQRGLRPLARLLQHRGSQALAQWRCLVLSRALQHQESYDSMLEAQATRWAVFRCRQRTLRAWCCVSRGPRRLTSAMVSVGCSRLRFAWNRLHLYAVRRGHQQLKSVCFSAALRRRRARCLEATMTAWRMQFCWVQRAQRHRLVNLHRRMAGRICRCALDSWLSSDARQRKLRRFGLLLWRVQGSIGMCTWRWRAARLRDAMTAKGLIASRQALVRQRTDCERLVEKRSIECAQRTAVALLHTWHCAAAAESALRAQRATAARALARVVAALHRNSRQHALHRWNAVKCALSVCQAADETFVCFQRDDRLECTRQGVAILHGIVERRRLLNLSRALHGPWRIARWQSLVRALDASSAREQRRLRSDIDLLKVSLAGAEEEASRSQDMWSGEAQRNQQAQEETASIVQAIERERRQHSAALDSLNFELQRTKDEELAAFERAREAEAHVTHEAAELQQELRETRARNALLEGERRTHMRDMAAVQNELAEVGFVAEEQGRVCRDREQHLGEHARGLAEHARILEERLRQTELATTQRARETEKTAEERAEVQVRAAAAEAEERARHAEKEIDRVIAERDRTSELQAAMAEEQDRSIRRLEDLLKEQADQLRRERRDHSKGLEHLKSSASLNESKTKLFEEQVAALRQQLHREQSELRASERAWASDRAALLAAVANSLPQVPRQSPQRSGSRRKCGSATSPGRKSGMHTGGRSCLLSPPARNSLASNSHSWGVCPWHGNGSSAGAQAALSAAAVQEAA